MPFETAATVAALALLKERAVQEAQQALRGDFLAQLLRGGASEAVEPALQILANGLDIASARGISFFT